MPDFLKSLTLNGAAVGGGGGGSVVNRGRPKRTGYSGWTIPGVVPTNRDGYDTSGYDNQRMYLAPIRFDTACVVSDLAITVTSAAGAGALTRFGLLSIDADWTPLAYIATGEVSTATVGRKTISGSWSVPAGMYMTFVWPSPAVTLRIWLGMCGAIDLLDSDWNGNSYVFPRRLLRYRDYSLGFGATPPAWDDMETGNVGVEYPVAVRIASYS